MNLILNKKHFFFKKIVSIFHVHYILSECVSYAGTCLSVLPAWQASNVHEYSFPYSLFSYLLKHWFFMVQLIKT